MEDTVDRHSVLRVLVEDGLWETANKCPAISLMNQRVHLGVSARELDACAETPQKVFAQANSLAFVSGVSLGDFLLGFVRDDQINGHNGYGSCASLRPRTAPNPGSSASLPSVVQALLAASRAKGRTRALPRDHPRGLPRAGATRRGSGQRPTKVPDSLWSFRLERRRFGRSVEDN
jgi:hypothetical protein